MGDEDPVTLDRHVFGLLRSTGDPVAIEVGADEAFRGGDAQERQDLAGEMFR